MKRELIMHDKDKQEMVEKINHIEKLLLDDRAFIMKMMSKIKKLFEFIDNFVIINSPPDIYFDETDQINEDYSMKELMKRLEVIKKIREELEKHRNDATFDQFGES